MLTKVPANFRLMLQVNPGNGVRAFGICIGSDDGYEGGFELRVEPTEQSVQ